MGVRLILHDRCELTTFEGPLRLIDPTFRRSEHGSDWNDYAALRGDAAAALVLKGAMGGPSYLADGSVGLVIL